MMEEALKTTATLLWVCCAINGSVGSARAGDVVAEESSQMPTVIYAVGKKSPTETDEFVVEQPAGASNPLGSPIVVPEEKAQIPENIPQNLPLRNPVTETPAAIDERSYLGALQPNQVPLPQPSDQIENEMYRSGSDIVDVQEYPIDDVDQMTRPINPATLVNQPEP